MKIKNYLFVLIAALSLISCSSQLTTLSSGQKIDKRLVGTWEGAEKDQQIEGLSKSWVMQRNADGTFELDFKFTQDGHTQNNIETGNWWIQDGLFHEKHNESGNTDVYSYTVLNQDQIKFVSKSISMDMNTDAYEFIDRRVKTSTSSNAIKVKSVAEEYEYIRKNCPGCKVESQSLIEKNSKPYDLIRVTKPDGTSAEFLFDIGSFFGKF